MNRIVAGRDVVSTEASPQQGVSAAASRDYTWTGRCDRVSIANHPLSGVNIHVKWNDTGASTTHYDDVAQPGDTRYSPPGLSVSSASLYFTGAADWGTDFILVGWK